MTTSDAIIVAGGKGRRMKNSTRKQYLELAGVPILCRTIQPFHDSPAIQKIFVVTPKGETDFCRDLIRRHTPALCEKMELVEGGAERQDSVYAGMVAAGGNQKIILIHDAVRPFATVRQISDCIETAARSGACLLGLQPADTLKEADPSGIVVKTLNRDRIRLAQTPQAFRYSLLREAYEAAKREGFTGTDDASLVEKMGWPVTLLPGSQFNIKITTPDDFELAACLLQMMPRNE